MKEHSTVDGNSGVAPAGQATQGQRRTIGLDVGDRSSHYCILSGAGQLSEEGKVSTTAQAIGALFGGLQPALVALEVGTHSPWLSRRIASCGHEVVVANPRNLPLLTHSSRKTDRMDARALARFARADVELLSPIRHRSEQVQADLLLVRSRMALLEARTKLVNAARGFAKSMGTRLRSADTATVGPELARDLEPGLRLAVQPLLRQVSVLTAAIRTYDREIGKLAQRYPQIRLLQEVPGIGPLVATTFVLTVEDGQRFGRTREVGCYLGLRPRKQQSGDSDPQLGISKEGDRYLRSLLVNSAQYILGPFAPPSALRTWGLQLVARGGTAPKQRAVVAVARKLAVLLLTLWKSGRHYEPFPDAASETV